MCSLWGFAGHFVDGNSWSVRNNNDDNERSYVITVIRGQLLEPLYLQVSYSMHSKININVRHVTMMFIFKFIFHQKQQTAS